MLLGVVNANSTPIRVLWACSGRHRAERRHLLQNRVSKVSIKVPAGGRIHLIFKKILIKRLLREA